ncbi:Growth-regulating factor [Abeliophyllum distichum]|uniref:Growth-regulating factor n=1 Tax=Abeliophyllum distichum TaxID=126358 RepID=A0ABD1RVK3_9LAMI
MFHSDMKKRHFIDDWLINGQSHNSFLDPKSTFLQGSLTLNAHKTQTTRHFIDGLDGISNQSSTSAMNNKYFSPFLTLSMSGRNGIDEDSEDANMGIIMMNNSDRDGPNGDAIFKAQWENPVSWMNSPPGVPLGEALCLGSANTTNSWQ